MAQQKLKRLRRTAASQSESQVTQSPAELSDFGDPVILAATRVRAEAGKRGWISSKSSKALEVVVQGQRKLTSSERNALDFLLTEDAVCVSVARRRLSARARCCFVTVSRTKRRPAMCQSSSAKGRGNSSFEIGQRVFAQTRTLRVLYKSGVGSSFALLAFFIRIRASPKPSRNSHVLPGRMFLRLHPVRRAMVPSLPVLSVKCAGRSASVSTRRFPRRSAVLLRRNLSLGITYNFSP